MLPTLFSPRRLHTRIAAVYLALLLVVQAVSFWFIQGSVDGNARQSIHQELNNGREVFLRLLAQNTANLEQAARVLTADYGFRSAVASNDQETLQSALENNNERAQASLGVFTDAQFNLKATAGNASPAFIAAVEHYGRQVMSGEGMTPSAEVIDGQLYQIVAVPVRAPAIIGWVGMGFRVDQSLLRDMQRLSGLEVAVLQRKADGHWTLNVSTINNDNPQALVAAWEARMRSPDDKQAGRTQANIVVANAEYSTEVVTLPGASGQEGVSAVLLRSVDEALAPYRQLKLALLVLSGLGIGVFAVGSLFTAQHVTTPLRALSAVAKRLERGDYGAEVDDPKAPKSRDEIGELAQSFESMRQAIQARESEILRLAYQDALTDLPNREQFRHDLRQAIHKATTDGTPCAVLLLDLDRFKHVNDVLGHRFGDRLLRAVAMRLRDEALRGVPSILARLNGDEFAVLLPNTDAPSALNTAKRILASFEQPITLDDHTVDLGAGIGVASSPEHGVEADAVLGRAEVAMYAAKAQQAGSITYHPGLDSNSQESLTLLSELRYAVDNNQLRLFLQPKIDLRTGAVLGAEALVRWEHPERGLVPPMRFIPFAEQTGFIRVLTMWMLDQVAQMSQALNERNMRLKIAVNLSTRDLMDQELPTKIEALLNRYQVDPSLLVLEITESAIMDDPQRALGTLNRLHDMGMKLSIDDFGTGYSSLAYLKRLPVDELKIDRSFVMNMERDVQDAKIVRSTIELAHNLGLSVVAEGIENAEAWKLLAALACDEAQGYFIAKPMPSDQFVGWVKQWRPPEATQAFLGMDLATMA